MQQTGMKMQHVQYKGGSQATTDLLAGSIDAHMMSSAVAAGQAENPQPEDAGGREQAAAPTPAEGADHGGGGRHGRRADRRGLRCSARRACRTCCASASRAELVAIAQDPAYQTKFRSTGFEPLGLDAAATERVYREEIARWFALVKASADWRRIELCFGSATDGATISFRRGLEKTCRRTLANRNRNARIARAKACSRWEIKK